MVFHRNKATPWSNLQVRTCKMQAKLDSKLDPSVAKTLAIWKEQDTASAGLEGRRKEKRRRLSTERRRGEEGRMEVGRDTMSPVPDEKRGKERTTTPPVDGVEKS